MYSNFLVKELDITFNLKYALDYLSTLESKFLHLRWEANITKDTITDADKQDCINDVYGWGIQSNLENLSEPCPPYNIHKNGSDVYRNTPLVFGFAEWLLEQFPYARQMSIAAHPPGTKIRTHTDTEKWFKIHIPLITNDKSYFIIDNKNFILTPGKMYLVNTSIPHSTYNQGDNIRIHLFFKIPSKIIYDKSIF